MPIQSVSANTGSTAGATSSTTTANTMGDMDTTFMNLLITELKCQDPTAPVDPTEMVGQMVSLNQLDQLIAIHQILQTNSGTTGTVAAANGGK